MKGVYMVDADRLFVQHFENLLFNNSNEYKMLGHNFKANDFLNKLKERSDLLSKIDLLFVNPKLIDLNGLELIKKVQTFRKDINVCVIVNENMRTFYQNEISELGLEHIIIYPNSDEYYLNSVKSIFKKIEHGSNVNQNIQNNTMENAVTMKDEDVFAELHSSDFLKQFDFDALSDDFFKKQQKDKDTSDVNKTEVIGYEDNNKQFALDDNSFNVGSMGSKVEQSMTETHIGNTYMNGNQSFVTPTFGLDVSQESGQSFVTPNFGMDDMQEQGNGFGVDLFGDTKYQSHEINDSVSSDHSFNPNLIGNTHYNTPMEDKNNFSDFGYNVSNKQNNIFENEGYSEPQFNEHNVKDSGYGNQEYQTYKVNNVKEQNPYGNDFGFNNKSFVEQRENNFNVTQAENYGNENNYNGFGYTTEYDDKRNNDLFNTNQSDIPGNPLDLSLFGVAQDNNDMHNHNVMGNNRTYSDYSSTVPQNNSLENNIYNNDDVSMPYHSNGNGHQKTNLQNINRPDVDDFVSYGKQGGSESYMPYGSLNDNAQQYGANGDIDNNNVNRHRGFTRVEEVNKNNNILTSDKLGNSRDFKNPYDEYSFSMKNREAMQQSQEVNNQQGFGGQHNQQGFGFNMNKYNSGVEQGQSERPFGGFDFSKPISHEAKRESDINLNKTRFNDSDVTGFGTQTSNKAVIENMYNKTGVDGLNYSPISNMKESTQSIAHERSNNAVYNEVPDFAKQVVAFYSTKGGIGKTSLAVNATIQLAKYSKKKICLIDFDVTNANVHTHLGILDSTYDLSVISNFESEIDSFSLSRIVTPYRVKDKDGETVEFDVIVGFKEMKMSERFNEREVHKILSILEEMYDIVVVDTHPVYTDITISTILKKATKIIFISEQEMTALNGAKDFILASKRCGIPAEKLFMVLNRYKSQTTIFTKNRIEKSLNKTILATVPADMDHLRDAVNTNNPIALANPDCELSRAYIDVAKIIDTSMVVPEETKGFFKRFKR